MHELYDPMVLTTVLRLLDILLQNIQQIEQNIQQVAGVTWSFVSIGLCWSITTIAMPHGVSII